MLQTHFPDTPAQARMHTSICSTLKLQDRLGYQNADWSNSLTLFTELFMSVKSVILICACQSHCNWGGEQKPFLWSPHTKHISNIHKHTCAHKHMHTCSQLENCLVVMCHVCEERQIGRKTVRVRESRGWCWQIPDTKTVCYLSPHMQFAFTYHVIFFFVWADYENFGLILFAAV